MADVTNACLHALYSLLEHSNGTQLGHIMRASFDSLDRFSGWGKVQHCCWLAQKASEWSQYQYRYAVPTWLVERLLETPDSSTTTSVHNALLVMITAVFSSPTPLINLSTSDIISNLLTLLFRRISIDPEDPLLSALVDCIASLGRHVYYSDQIQDLGMELINRLITVEVQGVPGPRKASYAQSRSQIIRCLLAALLGIIRAADKNDGTKTHAGIGKNIPQRGSSSKLLVRQIQLSQRTRVPADGWQDTLSILCDENYCVRADYFDALVFYLENEIPKQGEQTSATWAQPATEGPRWHATSVNISVQGDSVTKFLNALHAYLYVLATTSYLGHTSCSTPTPEQSTFGDSSVRGLSEKSSAGTADIQHSPASGRRSITLAAAPQSRKASIVRCLLDRIPSNVSSSAIACASDYAHILAVLTTVHRQLPVSGLLTSVPMLLALESAVKMSDMDDPATAQRVMTIKEVIARVWLEIAKVWDCSELLEMSQTVGSSHRLVSHR
jgi:protein EFR3